MAFYVCLILTILWFFFMTYLSHQDGEHTSRASRDLAEHLRFLDTDINDLNGKLRRAAHIVVFAVFTFLLGLTLDFGGASLKWMIIAAVENPLNNVKNRERNAHPFCYSTGQLTQIHRTCEGFQKV